MISSKAHMEATVDLHEALVRVSHAIDFLDDAVLWIRAAGDTGVDRRIATLIAAVESAYYEIGRIQGWLRQLEVTNDQP